MKRLLRILTVALMAAMTSSAYAADDKYNNYGNKVASSDGTACVTSFSGCSTYAASDKCTACYSCKTPSSDGTKQKL